MAEKPNERYLLRHTVLSIAKRLFGRQGLLHLPGRLEIEARLATAYSRAAATAATREIDPTQPLSWEFSGFSQHGEDGIVDYLCGQMSAPNRYFFEIGGADGLQNCSAWLAFARRFSGVMVEGNPDLSRRCVQVLKAAKCHNILAVNQLVDQDNIASLMKRCPHAAPDVFIIDIDGIDYYIVERVLEMGFLPKLLVVEYNSVFGSEQAVTIPYEPAFSRRAAHESLLYYGVSLAGWRALLEGVGYRFVTVDSNGTNAFFIQPDAFPEGFSEGLRGLDFRDNQSDRNGGTTPYLDGSGEVALPPRDWQQQQALIQGLPLVTVPRER